MAKNTFISNSEEETQNIGIWLAEKILKSKRKKITVLALIGELGSGKTTFVRGFLKFFGIKEFIQSPSFLIIKEYKINPKSKIQNSKLKKIFHIDCYRLKKPKEILYLGFKELLKEKNAIVLIEWAEKILKFLPKNTIKIYFEHLQKNKRKIKIFTSY